MDDRFVVSSAASALWAKTDGGEGQAWLPLFVHMIDAAETADYLWSSWVPKGVRAQIARAFDGDELLALKFVDFLAGMHDIGKATPAFQYRRICFTMGDVANPLADRVRDMGFDLGKPALGARIPSHALLGLIIYTDFFAGAEALPRRKRKKRIEVVETYASVIGCHHGSSPTSGAVVSAREEEGLLCLASSSWSKAREELIGLCLMHAGLSDDDIARMVEKRLPSWAASLIAGIVIMADWISSDQNRFCLLPMIPSSEEGIALQAGRFSMCALRERASDALRDFDILPPWKELVTPNLSDPACFAGRFDFSSEQKPRPVQLAACSVASNAGDPGLLIIEAPMGEGKTEAALAAAEIMACRSGRGGIAIALPTMATTDAMFGRVRAWLDNLPNDGRESRSMYLAHGKAQLNEEYRGLMRDAHRKIWIADDESGNDYEGIYISDWLSGRKKGMLSNFVVCTVDQVLMGALQMKHLPLRELSLANKVVVIDECHACDIYMQEYLVRVIEWLGCWKTPVIILSATMPGSLRDRLVKSYLMGRQLGMDASGSVVDHSDGNDLKGSYPLLTFTDGDQIFYEAPSPSGRALCVSMACMPDELDALVALMKDLLEDGGCAGVVCNTVRRAQKAAAVLSEFFGAQDVMLVHSRFTDLDRMDNEKKLRLLLGPESTRENGGRPHLLIVVGTQVLEQSLDIDFDVLITDIAPVDLMFQRMGRMHRHGRGSNDRPKKLGEARCFVRGVKEWEQGVPEFDTGIERVYSSASLLEALGCLGLCGQGSKCEIVLPGDIAPKVRSAYGEDRSSTLPNLWMDVYEKACAARQESEDLKRSRARFALLKSVVGMERNASSLIDWYGLQIDGGGKTKSDRDRGQRAVRDTQETIEVLLVREDSGSIRLLPWIGDPAHGVALGGLIPTDFCPGSREALVVAQSAIRLPIELSSPEKIDALIEELERLCGRFVGAWQESSVLAGCLVLPMHLDEEGEYGAEIAGKRLIYSKKAGMYIK